MGPTPAAAISCCGTDQAAGPVATFKKHRRHRGHQFPRLWPATRLAVAPLGEAPIHQQKTFHHKQGGLGVRVSLRSCETRSG